MGGRPWGSMAYSFGRLRLSALTIARHEPTAPPIITRRRSGQSDIFQLDTAGFRAVNTHREHHHQHAGHDEANHPRGAGVL